MPDGGIALRNKDFWVRRILPLGMLCILACIFSRIPLVGISVVQSLIPYIAVFLCLLIIGKGNLTFINIVKIFVAAFLLLPVFDAVLGVLASVLSFNTVTASIVAFVQAVAYIGTLILIGCWISKKKCNGMGKKTYITLAALSLLYSVLRVLCEINFMLRASVANTLFDYVALMDPSDSIVYWGASLVFYGIVFYASAKLSDK